MSRAARILEAIGGLHPMMVSDEFYLLKPEVSHISPGARQSRRRRLEDYLESIGLGDLTEHLVETRWTNPPGSDQYHLEFLERSFPQIDRIARRLIGAIPLIRQDPYIEITFHTDGFMYVFSNDNLQEDGEFYSKDMYSYRFDRNGEGISRTVHPRPDPIDYDPEYRSYLIINR